MADIIPDIIPDPDNSIYSPRVMGYQVDNLIQGGTFDNQSDLSYWGSYNSVLSITSGGLNIAEPPESENQPYTSAYQTINVMNGRTYDINIEISGLSTVFIRIIDGQFIEGSQYQEALVAEYICNPSSGNFNFYTRFFNFSQTITIILAVEGTNTGRVNNISFSTKKYPVLDESKWLLDTWFISYSKNFTKHLDNWGNAMLVGFKAGQSPSGWIYHIDLGWGFIVPQIYQIGDPDIWIWLPAGVPNLGISSISSSFGWVLLKRAWVGFSHQDFNSTGISGHTDGQGILCYSDSEGKYFGIIKNSSGQKYIKEIGSGNFVTF